MEYFSLIGSIMLIHFLAVMSPGPDFVMVLKNAMQYNRRIAVFTSFGIALGIGIHITYSIVSVSYLLKTNLYILNTIKFIGALYIIYIGYQTIASKQNNQILSYGKNKNSISISEAVKIGFITNAFNPKASIFFLSIFSGFIPLNTPNRILIILSFLIILVTFLWFTTVSVLFTNEKIIKMYKKYDTYIIKTLGYVLLLFGLLIIVNITNTIR
jgi:threonine/homoserine/homoserine lactone efflux protein